MTRNSRDTEDTRETGQLCGPDSLVPLTAYLNHRHDGIDLIEEQRCTTLESQVKKKNIYVI